MPMLFDAKIAGVNRKLVAVANRNGFYYVLDRGNGKFVSATPYTRQTWNAGFDAQGRPIVRPDTEPTIQGTLVSPDFNGGTIWQSPSFSPRTRMVYIPMRDTTARYFKRDTPYQQGEYYLGGGADKEPFEPHRSAIRAVDAATGEHKWDFTLLTPPWSGVLSTAGDLVFSGSDEGIFYSLNAKSGELLWHVQLGGAIAANPVSYAVSGHQYVAIAADKVLYVFALPGSQSSKFP